MHSQTQLHQEGPRNKLLTFIGLRDHGVDLTIPKVEGVENTDLAGISLASLLQAALDANQKALFEAGRPSIAIYLPKLTPFHLGELIFFFETATAVEGELLDVNSYDQPGVEAYKKHLRQWLQKEKI